MSYLAEIYAENKWHTVFAEQRERAVHDKPWFEFADGRMRDLGSGWLCSGGFVYDYNVRPPNKSSRSEWILFPHTFRLKSGQLRGDVALESVDVLMKECDIDPPQMLLISLRSPAVVSHLFSRFRFNMREQVYSNDQLRHWIKGIAAECRHLDELGPLLMRYMQRGLAEKPFSPGRRRLLEPVLDQFTTAGLSVNCGSDLGRMRWPNFVVYDGQVDVSLLDLFIEHGATFDRKFGGAQDPIYPLVGKVYPLRKAAFEQAKAEILGQLAALLLPRLAPLVWAYSHCTLFSIHQHIHDIQRDCPTQGARSGQGMSHLVEVKILDTWYPAIADTKTRNSVDETWIYTINDDIPGLGYEARERGFYLEDRMHGFHLDKRTLRPPNNESRSLWIQSPHKIRSLSWRMHGEKALASVATLMDECKITAVEMLLACLGSAEIVCHLFARFLFNMRAPLYDADLRPWIKGIESQCRQFALGPLVLHFLSVRLDAPPLGHAHLRPPYAVGMPTAWNNRQLLIPVFQQLLRDGFNLNNGDHLGMNHWPKFAVRSLEVDDSLFDFFIEAGAHFGGKAARRNTSWQVIVQSKFTRRKAELTKIRAWLLEKLPLLLLPNLAPIVLSYWALPVAGTA